MKTPTVFDLHNINYHIVQNLYDIYELSHNYRAVESHVSNVCWIKNTTSPWPNFIYNLQLSSNNAEIDISILIEHIKSKKTPPFCIVDFQTTPSNTQEILDKYGFLAIEEWYGMAINLVDINLKIPFDDSKIQIKEVITNHDLNCWLQIVSSELFKKKNFDLEFIHYLQSTNKIKLYLGLYENNPAATLMLFLSNHTAGIYMVTTKKEYRNKGLGKMITERALCDAANDDYQVGVLQSTTMGASVYKKIGFKEYSTFQINWLVGKEFK